MERLGLVMFGVGWLGAALLTFHRGMARWELVMVGLASGVVCCVGLDRVRNWWTRYRD